jgi:hypothetical protein
MEGEIVCANCGIKVHWQPTVIDGVAYCCLGCSRGGPCECDYSNLPQPGDKVALVPKAQTEESEFHSELNAQEKKSPPGDRIF